MKEEDIVIVVLVMSIIFLLFMIIAPSTTANVNELTALEIDNHYGEYLKSVIAPLQSQNISFNLPFIIINDTVIMSKVTNFNLNGYDVDFSYINGTFKKHGLHNSFDFLKNYNNGYGYWLWAEDMYKVNLSQMSENGVSDIFLNSFAFTEYGERDVLDWIQSANDCGIRVHIWVQVFYEGEWVSPVYTNGSVKIGFLNEKLRQCQYYAGLDGVSGIQLDYLRFEGNAYAFNNSTQTITYFVKECSNAIKEKNPNIIVSSTIMPEPDSMTYSYGQDVPNISSYVDVIVPMLYKGNYDQNTSWIKNTTSWYVNNTNASIWGGLQVYESETNLTNLSQNELYTDYNACIDGGADKVVLFRWGINKNVDEKGVVM